MQVNLRLTSLNIQDSVFGSLAERLFGRLSVTLKWSNNETSSLNLKRLNWNHCIYKGSFEDESNSTVLLTGCRNEMRGIQIHSVIYGDTLASVAANGDIQIFLDSNAGYDMTYHFSHYTAFS